MQTPSQNFLFYAHMDPTLQHITFDIGGTYAVSFALLILLSMFHAKFVGKGMQKGILIGCFPDREILNIY